MHWQWFSWLRLADVRDANVALALNLLPASQANPLTQNPSRSWSQADEDGILAKILNRIGSGATGHFIEFGVGNGSENNTLSLLAQGWSGAWLGNEGLCFRPEENGRLRFMSTFLTLETVAQRTREALSPRSLNECDVVSMDLDGNDFYLSQKLLQEGLTPKVWISEYNARFPVGSNWVMPYDENHEWLRDDYYGASFSAMSQLFRDHGYFPVACSCLGVNVFFVRADFKELFLDVPEAEGDIYRSATYLSLPKWGHKPSPKTLRSLTAR